MSALRRVRSGPAPEVIFALHAALWARLPPRARVALGAHFVRVHNRYECRVAYCGARWLRLRDLAARLRTALAPTGWPGLVEIAPGITRRCGRCGCVEALACAGGCAWVAWDLCSACAPGGAP